MVQLKYYKVNFWRWLKNAEEYLGKLIVPTQPPRLTEANLKELPSRHSNGPVMEQAGDSRAGIHFLTPPGLLCNAHVLRLSVSWWKGSPYCSPELEDLNKSTWGRSVWVVRWVERQVLGFGSWPQRCEVEPFVGFRAQRRVCLRTLFFLSSPFLSIPPSTSRVHILSNK